MWKHLLIPLAVVVITAVSRVVTTMSNEKLIDNVLIVVAMEAEAAPFVEHLKLDAKPDFFPKHAPFVAYQGNHKGCKLTVAVNGKDTVYETGVDAVGTVPAALVTFLGLQVLGDADLVINAGTCGGFKSKGAAIGDAYLLEGAANHDRRIPIPPFIPYGIGKLETCPAPKLAEAHGFKTGICTTGNSLDATQEDQKLMGDNNASVKDMEAAAIAWSCKLYGDTPYLGLKVVTDIVDGDKPTQEEFMENLGTAAKSLQDALPKVIEHVCGRETTDL